MKDAKGGAVATRGLKTRWALGCLCGLVLTARVVAAQEDEWVVLADNSGPLVIAAAGCTVVDELPRLDMLLVDCANGDPQVLLSSRHTIAVPNFELQLEGSAGGVEFDAEPVVSEEATDTLNSNPDRHYQWYHDVIGDDLAWDAGCTGAGVRVALVDTGVKFDHPDLAQNLSVEASRSFVSGVPDPGWDDYLTGHGTAVAGVIAAADNDIDGVGIAPNAEIISIKVCRSSGGCPLWSIVQGLNYVAWLADPDCNETYCGSVDLVNLSFGGMHTHHGYCSRAGWASNPHACEEAGGVWIGAEFYAYNYTMLYDRAFGGAWRSGALLIAGAGNFGLDLLHDGDTFFTPGWVPTVLSVAATGPRGLVFNPDLSDPDTDLEFLDERAWGCIGPCATLGYYSNYGQTVVDLAAPGGSSDYCLQPPPGEQCAMYTYGPLPWCESDWLCWMDYERPAFSYDMIRVLYANAGPIEEQARWWYGTSLSAPMVTGVAALLIEANGGEMAPAQIRHLLMSTADDLGEPGRDPYFGAGRVSAGNYFLSGEHSCGSVP